MELLQGAMILENTSAPTPMVRAAEHLRKDRRFILGKLKDSKQTEPSVELQEALSVAKT
jgi:hypothetical protein